MNKWLSSAVVLMMLILTACGGSSNMGVAETEPQDCEFGVSGNGDCLREGESGIPEGH